VTAQERRESICARCEPVSEYGSHFCGRGCVTAQEARSDVSAWIAMPTDQSNPTTCTIWPVYTTGTAA
jgi:hypothetical protein